MKCFKARAVTRKEDDKVARGVHAECFKELAGFGTRKASVPSWPNGYSARLLCLMARFGSHIGHTLFFLKRGEKGTYILQSAKNEAENALH